MSKQENIDKNSSYNDEPLYYCKDCLSLGIKEGEFGDHCIHCGSTNVGVTTLLGYHMLKFRTTGIGLEGFTDTK